MLCHLQLTKGGASVHPVVLQLYLKNTNNTITNLLSSEYQTYSVLTVAMSAAAHFAAGITPNYVNLYALDP